MTDAAILTANQPPAFGSGEFAFTRRDFGLIAAMLHKDAGIVLAEIKAPLVYSRLVKRLRALGIENFRDYCALVGRDSDEGAQEREHMVAALTTNITRFFREPHHFEHLATKVLPNLTDRIRRGAKLRIWSAGCSTGEEPYSIALTVLKAMPDAFRHDVRILATDINKLVLAKAQRGIYGEAALAPVPPSQRNEWFTPVHGDGADGKWRVGEALQALVAFRELNLMAPWPMKQKYEAIYCRNVAIYFAESAQNDIWNRFADLLAPGGFLYLGHSERINQSVEKFALDGLTTYRLRNGESP